MMEHRRELTPREIVAELDKFVVGQGAAKRAVAVAVRNRYRRQLLPSSAQEEIYPKNILMIGPTGVGKTEIARRLARLVNAPFVKVEATKFTEVGYVGRDVESMVRDLVETALRMVRSRRTGEVADEAASLAERRLLDLLAPLPGGKRHQRSPLEALIGSLAGETGEQTEDSEAGRVQADIDRSAVKLKLAAGELESELVEIEVDDQAPPLMEMFTGTGMEEIGVSMGDVLGQMMPRRRKRRRVTVTEARRLLTAEEATRLVDAEQCSSEAISWAEQSGIIFLDEIDKVAGVHGGTGPDVSREGVQRDILPIVEGSTVMTRYGQVRTDHVLFIAAGAFHMSKPSDLIPELQGRFPIRVELDSLERDDFRRILTEPRNALVRQYQQLLGVEGMSLTFTAGAIEELADLCVKANDRAENIGARRLHTLMERVLDELSFEASDLGEQTITITDEYVRKRLKDLIADGDLTRYIL